MRPDSNFIMIGERTNVTGSRKFARLILDGEFEEAVAVAREQVEGGANIIDVNMDEGLLDGEAAMTTFLNLIAAEPEVARVPIMVDSSKWSVHRSRPEVRAGQGASSTRSASRKAKRSSSRKARLVRRYGAAVVVMAFDEQARPTPIEHKVRICQRAYRLLTEEVGFPPRGHHLRPEHPHRRHGIEEHNNYAINFIEATRQIKRDAAPARRSRGGVSNISFSFRGNDVVREAMHAAFLYHAIRAGLDMGIVNAGQLAVYEEIPAELLERVEDVLLNRRPDATERLVELRRDGQAAGHEARRGPALARGAGRRAPVARAGQRHRRVHRGRTSKRPARSTRGRSRSSKGR